MSFILVKSDLELSSGWEHDPVGLCRIQYWSQIRTSLSAERWIRNADKEHLEEQYIAQICILFIPA